MHTAATVVLLSSSNKILMQLRDDGNGKTIPYPTMWNLPGGEKEEGESYIACAIREIKEEFELEISPNSCKEIFKYNHDNTTNDTVFACKIHSEPVLELHEGAAIAWMTLDEIKKLKLGFEQEKIIPHIEHYLSSGLYL